MKKFGKLALSLSSMLILGACTDAGDAPQQEPAPGDDTSEMTDTSTMDTTAPADDRIGTDEEAQNIVVDMYNSDSESIGKAIFSETEDGVMIQLDLEGLPSGDAGDRMAGGVIFAPKE